MDTQQIIEAITDPERTEVELKAILNAATEAYKAQRKNRYHTKHLVFDVSGKIAWSTQPPNLQVYAPNIPEPMTVAEAEERTAIFYSYAIEAYRNSEDDLAFKMLDYAYASSGQWTLSAAKEAAEVEV